MNKLIKILSIIALSFIGSACSYVYDDTKGGATLMGLETGNDNPIYQKAYADGCQTGLATYGNDIDRSIHKITRDPKYSESKLYDRIWIDSYNFCRHHASRHNMFGLFQFNSHAISNNDPLNVAQGLNAGFSSPFTQNSYRNETQTGEGVEFMPGTNGFSIPGADADSLWNSGGVMDWNITGGNWGAAMFETQSSMADVTGAGSNVFGSPALGGVMGW